MRLRRSCLSVPASSARMLAKAPTLAADEVLVDLEDAVAPAEKTDETRERAAAAIAEADWGARTLAVRINGVETPWAFRDLEVVVERAGARVDCVIVPKVEDVSHVHFVAHLLGQLEATHRLGRRIGIELLIETARGLVQVEDIARASERTEALVFGPGDLAASLGVPQTSIGQLEPDYPGDQWHYARSRIVAAARAYGLQAIDGPYAAIRDLDGFRASARRSALLGFEGKWVVHPDQIPAANELFAPTREQFDEAERVLDVYRRAREVDHTGAALHDGHMLDEASRKLAEAVVVRGRAAGLGNPRG